MATMSNNGLTRWPMNRLVLNGSGAEWPPDLLLNPYVVKVWSGIMLAAQRKAVFPSCEMRYVQRDR